MILKLPKTKFIYFQMTLADVSTTHTARKGYEINSYYLSVFNYTHQHMHMHMPMPTHTHIHTHTHTHTHTYIYIYIYIYIYTGCPRRNVPDFGRVFLMLSIPI